MSINPYKRKCSAVSSNGHPCQAWAVIESEPALCSAHCGRSVGAGAPKGNRNGMKHGLYMSTLKADEIADLEMAKTKTPEHELLLLRSVLRRLAKYLNDDDLPMATTLAIVPLMITGTRTVVYLLNNIKEDTIDWDEVLDNLGDDLGVQF